MSPLLVWFDGFMCGVITTLLIIGIIAWKSNWD